MMTIDQALEQVQPTIVNEDFSHSKDAAKGGKSFETFNDAATQKASNKGKKSLNRYRNAPIHSFVESVRGELSTEASTTI